MIDLVFNGKKFNCDPTWSVAKALDVIRSTHICSGGCLIAGLDGFAVDNGVLVGSIEKDIYYDSDQQRLPGKEA